MSLYICMDGGATRTRAGLYDGSGALLRELEAGPANPLAYGDAQCFGIVSDAIRRLAPDAGFTLALGLAGVGGEEWRARFCPRFAALPHCERVRITSDLDPLLHANAPRGRAVFAIAGTGSSVLGMDAEGRVIRIGGRGTVFGDEGSGYGLAVRALHAAARAHDGYGPETALEHELPTAAGLGAFDDLTAWSLGAPKHAIAALAGVVTRLAEAGDAEARNCVARESALLARQIEAALGRCGAQADCPVFVTGGLAEKNALYLESVKGHLAHLPGLDWQCPPPLRGHRALLPLAQQETPPAWCHEWRRGDAAPTALPETEQPAREELDALAPEDIVRAMLASDAAILPALDAQRGNLARCIGHAAAAISGGGRIIYAGAGTSGRLGALDAAECPPTFGIAPDRVAALMAGGPEALLRSIEGAEDDAARAREDAAALGITDRDFVVGVAASGTTPYTLAVLEYAAQCGARTALVCCNPHAACAADVVVGIGTGAEVLPGSTRLKAGTATKIALNIISTGAMARAGYIYRGRMVHMRPTNAKLRARAARIIAELGGVPEGEAGALLEAAEGCIATALIMYARNCGADDARRLLHDAGGSLRDVLE